MALTNLGNNLHHIVDLSLLDENSVIIDAGAAVGGFVEKIRTFVDCKILAIECSRNNLNILKNKDFKNIDIIEKALVGIKKETFLTEFAGEYTEKDLRIRKPPLGTRKFYQWANIFDNRGEAIKKHNVEVSQYQVATTTLAEIIVEYNLKSIDYLKMDIEGAEHDIFEFLAEKDASAIKQISLEFHVRNRKEKISIFRNLKSLGFVVQEFPNNELYAIQRERL